MKQFLMRVVLCCGCLSFGVASAMNADILAMSSEDYDILATSSEDVDVSTISSDQETHALQNIVGLMSNKNIEEETIKEAISSYLNNGFDINARYGEFKETLLHIAANSGRNEVAKFLIDKEIDVNIINKPGNTALHYAAGGNDADLVRLLIKKQKDINLRDGDGCTAIYKAAYQLGSYEIQISKGIIQVLLDNGGNPAIKRILGLSKPISAIDIANLRKTYVMQQGQDVSQYQEIIDLMQSYVPQQ